jgi:hypothetical protein
VGAIFEWLRRFGFFTYIAGNVNIFVAGDRAGGTRKRAAGGPLLLRSTAWPAVRPKMEIRLASNRRVQVSDVVLGSANRQHIREGWKAVIKGLDVPRKGNR